MHGHFYSFACYRQQPYFPEADLSYPQLSPNYSENLFTSLPPASPQIIDNPKKFKDFFVCKTVLAANHQHPKKFKDFFACRIVLAANHQYPGKIQRPTSSSNQQQQSTTATSSSNSNQQQQPAAATSNSNQQQQPAAATRNSNQQQQPAAATSSSNQQQQPAAATSSSNQHSSYQRHLHNQRRPPLVINTVPSRGFPASS